MKVALVHDWLTGMRGGEKCLLAFLALYPDADIFTLVHVPGSTHPRIDERVHHVSWLGQLPGASRWFRVALPLFPLAARSLDLSGYDLVISLSHAAVKNVVVDRRKTRHICYCFTPMRYIWDQHRTYLGRLSTVAAPLIQGLRRWDVAGSAGVDSFVAISAVVAARIRAFYHRRASILYPPVATNWVAPRSEVGGEAFLAAGALVPYKRFDHIVSVCSRLGVPLWVAGDGPERARLQSLAGPSVTFLGRVSDQELADRYRRAKAFIVAGREDFGMMAVEAQGAGCPVIAEWSGGARETVAGVFPTHWSMPPSPGSTGVFFRRGQNDLARALSYFLGFERAFTVESCLRQAQKFSPRSFFAGWQDIIASPAERRATRQPARIANLFGGG